MCRGPALAFLLSLIAGLASGCSSSASGPPPTPTLAPTPAFPTPAKGAAFSVTLVTDVGGLHDRSFNQLAWTGLRRARKWYGVNVNVRQSNSESEYIPNLTYAAQHYAGLNIAVGYSMPT